MTGGAGRRWGLCRAEGTFVLLGCPTDGIKPPQEPEPEWKGLSRADGIRLLSAAQTLRLRPGRGTNQGLRDHAAIVVLLGSGLRVSELLGLKREQYTGRGSRRNSKKAYGEWMETMREVALRPGTPLTQQDGLWKMVARYEGWYALGPQLFDEQLDLMRAAAVRVLRERDPKFDLAKDERFAASIYGKVLIHSAALRKGLTESLALLGSHPKALTWCSIGKAEATAVLACAGDLGWAPTGYSGLASMTFCHC